MSGKFCPEAHEEGEKRGPWEWRETINQRGKPQDLEVDSDERKEAK